MPLSDDAMPATTASIVRFYELTHAAVEAGFRDVAWLSSGQVVGSNQQVMTAINDER